jgi:hypothetical protein
MPQHANFWQQPHTHGSLMPLMQGESIAAQPATLLTRLTGLATLQVRRCGHWQEVRSIEGLEFKPHIFDSSNRPFPPAAQLAAYPIVAVEPVLALSAAAACASGMRWAKSC